MSTIRVNAIQNTNTTDGGISIDGSGHVSIEGEALPSAGPLSNRNVIINGAMQVSQRGTSFDVDNEDEFTLDRFTSQYSAGTFSSTFTQEEDGPQGFKNSLKVACDTAYTPVSSDNFGIEYRAEGQDVQHFGFGAAGAKDLTLSFYVKGTAKQYSCAVQFLDSSGNQHIQTRSFSVTSSWQRVALTFEGNGEALSTAIKNDNTVGFLIQWWLAAGPDDIFAADTTWVDNPSPTFHAVTGQENFFDSTSNEFFITGVQLEVGSVATPFEHRSFGDELARCQRYYYRISHESNNFSFGSGFNQTTSHTRTNVFFPVTMRSSPSALEQSGTAGDYAILNRTTSDTCSVAPIYTAATKNVAEVQLQTSTGITAGDGSLGSFTNTDAFLAWSAEL